MVADCGILHSSLELGPGGITTATMADEVEKRVEQVKEASSDKGLTQAAREAQDKPGDMKDQEQKHWELRKLGKTNSSANLPTFDVLIAGAREAVATIVDKFEAGHPERAVATDAATAAVAAVSDKPNPALAAAADVRLLGIDLDDKTIKDAGIGQPFRLGILSEAEEREARAARLDRVLDKLMEKVQEALGETKVKDAHDHLKDTAEKKLKDEPENLKRFKEDMDEFERRAKEAKPPLSPEEVAKTYQEVRRLMETEGDKPTDPNERLILAQQVMHQAAHPTEVRQGQHPTCNVAALESRLYTTNPSDVAKMVADAAIKGEYTTNPPPPAKGVTVKLDTQSLQPTGEASYHPPRDADRSYASQIFQVTASNIAWEKYNQKQNPPKHTHFEQHEESDPGKVPHDSGGRQVDYSDPKHPQVLKNSDKTPKTGTGVTTGEMVDIAREITGKPQDGSVIESANFGDKGVTRVSREEDLNAALAEAKRSGRLPVTIHVYSGKEPFATDSGNGKEGGSGGWHVVNVTDYKEGPPAKVKIDNQWDDKKDHLKDDNMVPVADLFKAMTSPYQDLKQEIRELEKQGKHDTSKELELLEMEKRDGDIKGDAYDKKLAHILAESEKRWNRTLKSGPPSAEDQDERERTIAKMQEILKGLPRKEREKVLQEFSEEVKKS